MTSNKLLLLFLMMVSPATSLASPLRVFVSGAGGQTGQSVFRKMLELSELFQPVGVVRTEASKEALVESGISPEHIVVADITDESAVQAAMKGCHAVCICTSAKPVPTGEKREDGRPTFGFPNGQPEKVDWLGQKHQIDAAKATGEDVHVVICSSMGGTNPNNPLNAIGKTTNEDGSTSGGDILLWKRKAEQYAMDSGLPYTIIHPGGLINEPGGERELVLGVDDSQEGTESRTVPREDVAELMIQSLLHPVYKKRSFDLRAKPVGDGVVTTDFEALENKWLDGKNCDYSLSCSS
eukprot:CAMPEP_0194033902 /NCGR_PEP_ID=MMETSP0009_2-20130614/6388_1 /TAXON_ID=210454 /ORGANISM="Grammatophora oceanica, Strain CCMP 410" /LENGTH=294 /DNA_ID=CAMNT_0038674633 /DNA_START=40 /DNA_END=924 /DNA_ORIENTATION=-